MDERLAVRLLLTYILQPSVGILALGMVPEGRTLLVRGILQPGNGGGGKVGILQTHPYTCYYLW